MSERSRREAKRAERRERLEGRLDRAIGSLFPGWAVKRARARETLRFLSQYRDTGTNRMHRSRTGLGGTANRHLASSTLWTQRERCRALCRENTLAMGLHQTDTDNVVHLGFVPQPKTDDEGWNAAAKEWYLYEHQRDVRGILANWEFQRLAYESARRDGDVGFVKTGGGQLQAVEADRIATPCGEAGKNALKAEAVDAVVNGIRFDSVGRPVGYCVADEHPTSSYVTAYTEVKAEDFLFLCSPHRFTASRGRPLLFPIIDELDRTEDAVEAAVWAYIMAACFGLVIKTNQRQASYGTSETNPSSGETEYWEDLEPGMIRRIRREDEISQVTPQHPGAQFEPLMKVLARFCGRHIGFPVELVWLDFTANNWSNTRASLLQVYRTFRRCQMWFEWGYCRPEWVHAVSHGVASGVLRPAPERWRTAVKWRKPGWQWVDILDQARARKMLVDNALMSRQDAVEDTGSEWFETVEELEAEEAALGRLTRLEDPKKQQPAKEERDGD